MKKSRALPLIIVVTAFICVGLLSCRDATAGLACKRLLDIERVVTAPEISDFDCVECICFSSVDGSVFKAFRIRFTINGGLTTTDCVEIPSPPAPTPGTFQPCTCDDLEEFDKAKNDPNCVRNDLFSSIEIDVERVIHEVEFDDPTHPQVSCTRGKESAAITIFDAGGVISYAQKRRTTGLGVVGVTDLKTQLCCDPFRNQATTLLLPPDKSNDCTIGTDPKQTLCEVRLLYESLIDFDVTDPCNEAAYFVDRLKISGTEECLQCLVE